MKIFDIMIDNNKYEYIDSIKLDNKCYVAYQDNDTIYISEYVVENNQVNFLEIDENTFNKVKEAMSL